MSLGDLGLEPPPTAPEGYTPRAAYVAPALAEAPPLPRFKLLTAVDLQALPGAEWAVHKVFPSHGLGCIFGPSTAGKSFLATDMIAAMAEGREWFGYRVKRPLRCVYVALEGQSGIRKRIDAWEVTHERPYPVSVQIVLESFDLTDRSCVLSLAAVIEAGAGADVIVIDTLNRAAPTVDENSSRDMGAVLEGSKELQAMTSSLVVLVSHVGKDASKGLRGHSSLFAALDAAVEVTREGDRREWRVAKAKDGEDGKVHAFRLEVVDVGEDDGEPVTSCVVRADHAEPQSDRPKLPRGGNQRLIYDALCPLFRESSAFGRAGAPPHRPCIDLEEAIRLTRDRLTVPTDRRTERTRQAITGLASTGVIGCNEGWIWLK